MAYKFEWENKAVGTSPGQHQTLEITLEYRHKDEIKISFIFSATSNGHDDFGPNNRNNYGYIWIGSQLVKPSSDNYTFKYNSYFGSLDTGTPKTHTRKGEVILNGIDRGTTSLNIYYQNDRINESGTYPNNPCTTGVFKKAKIGTLSIPDWKKCNISFKKGYKGGDISNVPNDINVYEGSLYPIPRANLIDNKNHYVFKNGYSTSKNNDVNTSFPTARSGDARIAVSDAIYYGCWKPQKYYYHFFPSYSFNSNEEFSTLNRTYNYADDPIELPNLNNTKIFNGLTSSEKKRAKKEGYEFSGWNSSRKNFSISDLSCNLDSDTNFYISWNAIKYNVVFDYGFNGYTRVAKNLTYDTTFNFSTVLKKQNNDTIVSNTLVRPGYKLVGWSYVKPNKIYNYNKSTSNNFNYKFDDKRIITLPPSTTSNEALKNGITLYAVWEYFALSYTYDKENDNKWKLALSYVYDFSTNSWKLAIPYIYDNSTKTWKV